MRIRKKWPPPTPPFPSETKLGKTPTDVPTQQETPTDVPTQQEKIGVSSFTTSTKAQGLHYERCFSVVEENRRIDWSFYQSSSSPHCLIEDDQTRFDPQLINPKEENGLIGFDTDKEEEKKCCMPYTQPQLKEFQGEVGEKYLEKSKSLSSIYQIKSNNSNVEVTAVLAPSSSSSHQVERWCDEEKTTPMKRRGRPRYQCRGVIMEKNEVMVTEVKAKRTCSQEDYDERDHDVKKRRVRGNILMEELRCSYVNGKWRCRQMTLVGYAFCQHHLGQARIKSMRSFGSSDSSVVIGTKLDDDNKNNEKSNGSSF